MVAPSLKKSCTLYLFLTILAKTNPMENKPFYNNNEDAANNIPSLPLKVSDDQTNGSQDSILLDVTDMSGYDKNLKRGRIWLYVISGLQVMLGVFEYVKYDNESDAFRWITFGIDATIGLIFLACALWSFKKPVAAFLTALILYIVITGSLMIIDPTNIISGIIIKILIVIALVRAYKDARYIEDMKQVLAG